MPITTVIFDYGCVLSLAPTPEDYEPLRQATGLDAAAFQETYWRHRDAYDGDALGVSAYWQDFGLAAGVTLSPGQIQELVAKDIQIWARTDPVMIEWARVLRQRGWKTAVLSNMSRSVGDYLRRTATWLELFDHLCFSGELRTTKPGAAIYHVCLEALGVLPAQTLFLDDRAVNIATARAIGMHGIVFQSTDQLMKELEPYGLAESLAEAKNRVADRRAPGGTV